MESSSFPPVEQGYEDYSFPGSGVKREAEKSPPPKKDWRDNFVYGNEERYGFSRFEEVDRHARRRDSRERSPRERSPMNMPRRRDNNFQLSSAALTTGTYMDMYDLGEYDDLDSIRHQSPPVPSKPRLDDYKRPPPPNPEPEMESKNECRRCELTFSNKSNLWEHIKRNDNDRRHKCCRCDQEFPSSQSFKIHRHGGEQECDICYKPCRGEQSKEAHMQEKHNVAITYKCMLCVFKGPGYSVVKDHINTCHDSKEVLDVGRVPWEVEAGSYLSCPECDKKCVCVTALNNHRNCHKYPEKTSEQEVFCCRYCDKKYFREEYLKEHEKTHPRNRRSESRGRDDFSRKRRRSGDYDRRKDSDDYDRRRRDSDDYDRRRRDSDDYDRRGRDDYGKRRRESGDYDRRGRDPYDDYGRRGRDPYAGGRRGRGSFRGRGSNKYRKKKHICHCGKIFAVEKSYENHLEVFHGIAPEKKEEEEGAPGPLGIAEDTGDFEELDSRDQDQLGDGQGYCVLCSKNFRNNHQLVVHEREEHPCRCIYCGTQFKIHLHYSSHARRRCRQCRICFLDMDDLMEHSARVHDMTIYKCDPCKKYFRKEKQMFTHFRKYHANQIPDHLYQDRSRTGTASEASGAPHKNNDEENADETASHKTGGGFMDNPQLISKSHKRFLNKVKCEECGEVLSSAHDKAVHMQTAHKESLLRCSNCKEEFPTAKARQHHQEFGFRCLSCNMCFFNHEEYTEHFRSPDHVGFKCEECGMSFSDKFVLQDHKKIHEKPDEVFTCRVCACKFPTIKIFEAHMLTSHPEPKEETEPVYAPVSPGLKEDSKEQPCSVCYTVFSNGRELRRHLRDSALCRVSNRCEECKEDFASSDLLFKHYDTAHPDAS